MERCRQFKVIKANFETVFFIFPSYSPHSEISMWQSQLKRLKRISQRLSIVIRLKMELGRLRHILCSIFF